MTQPDTWPRTHHDLVQHYHAQYEQGVQSGEFQPLIYPWGAFGAIVVIVYLLIPYRNRPWLQHARFLAFAWIAAFAGCSVRYTRAKGMAPAFGVGLISAWSVVWVAAILVANDAQTDFQRIERTEGVYGGSRAAEKRAQNGTADPHLQSMDVMNGEPKSTATIGREHNVHGQPGPSERHGEFAWQPYPLVPFVERVDWVLDIFCNFRGAGWNWRTSAVPPPPKWVQEQVRRNSSEPPWHSNRTHAGQTRMYSTRRELLAANAKTLLIGYFVIDALKTLLMHDPYFWGFVDRTLPPYFPAWLTGSPVLVRVYRLFCTQIAIKWALQTLFSLGPLFFTGALGPSMLGARAEPWMYPETWGSYSTVLDRGLAGWWSGWWHQTFRFAFEQPSRKLVQVTGMDPRSPGAKLVQLLVAFGLSGFLHASGSYTSAGATRPMSESMLFFVVQAVGVFVEEVLSQKLRGIGVQSRIPPRLMHAFTFMYVHAWFYFTAPLLANDFARAGIWLFEPVPISLFRGLGLGVEGDGWWCWGGKLIWWHRGDTWWRSGIAV